MRTNRQQKSNYAVFLLISELLNNDRLPPVTLGFIIVQVLIYLEYFFDMPSLNAVCLSAYSILNDRQWLRLVLSPLFHADDWHLYYNMSSFAIKGRSLERRFGSVYFCCLLVLFSVCCSLVLVGLEFTAFQLLGSTDHIHACAVGFSGVIFALKVLTTHYLPDGTNYMFQTIPVPNKYVYWAELIIISLVTPNASFAGHLAGILVGLLYIYGPLKQLLNIIVPAEHRRFRTNTNANEGEWRRTNTWRNTRY